MDKNIKNVLNEIDNIDQFHQFVEKIDPADITFWGGRKFTVKSKDTEYANVEGELSLNEIIRQFDILTEQNVTSIPPDTVIAIRSRIGQLDRSSNAKLAKAPIITKLFTWFRSTFGDAPGGRREFTIPSRQRVLIGIGYRIENSNKRSQYLAEEYYDERDLNVLESTQDLKKTISAICSLPSEENKTLLIKSIEKLFDNISQNRHNQKLFQEFFQLIYRFRCSNDTTLRSTLAPLLIAGFAKAQNWAIDFDAPAHTIRSIHVPDEGEEWSLYEDSGLVSKAHELYKNILKQ